MCPLDTFLEAMWAGTLSYRRSERLSDLAQLTKLPARRTSAGSQGACPHVYSLAPCAVFLSNDRFSDTWSFGSVTLELQRISLSSYSPPSPLFLPFFLTKYMSTLSNCSHGSQLGDIRDRKAVPTVQGLGSRRHPTASPLLHC